MKMFAMKSKILQASLGLAAALPLATAGAFTFANSAEAAYIGSFKYSTSDRNPDDEPTTVTISNQSVNFFPNPGAILLTGQTGDFASDKRGFIKNFQINPFTSPSAFIDVGLNDGIKLFSLTSIDPVEFESVSGGTKIILNYKGIFEDGSKAIGAITFLTLDTKANQTYNNGQTINATFNGLAVTSVPEPATLLGLGLTGAAMFVSRRRKGQAVS